jgi:regulator of sigma E protease
MLITILATAVVLGVLIFVHELGHFTAAKLVDIEVPRFSIGLGPKVIGFTRGETEYVICALPLGGYVKMAGTEEMEMIEGGGSKKPHVTGAGTAVDLGVETEDKRTARPRDFESKSLPARTLVISAGVIMNLIFALVVFTVSSLVWGVQVSPPAKIGAVAEELLPKGTEALAALPSGTVITGIGRTNVQDFRDVEIAIAKVSPGNLEFRFANHEPLTINLPAGDSVRASLVAAFEPAVKTPPAVGEIVKNSAAQRGGLQPHDRVLTAAGQSVNTWQQLVGVVEQYGGKPLPLVVQRGQQQLAITVTPEAKTLGNKRTYGRLGVYPEMSVQDALPRQRPGVGGAIKAGASRTWDVVTLTAGFLWDLITRKASARNVGGPILIGQLSGRVVRAGLEAFLGFMALFSVNLAVLNLLPIPVLDGGHLMFLAVEAVGGRGRSLPHPISNKH